MAVRIGKDDRGVRVSFMFDVERVGRIKKIPGHRWIASTKEWWLPATEETRIKIAELFSEDDIIFESGAEWFYSVPI